MELLLQKKTRLTLQLGQLINTLWKSELVKEKWATRGNVTIIDNAPYFFENAIRMSEDGYLPSTTDVLYTRSMTTGIVEYVYKLNKDTSYRLVDVGGQHSERKKWFHLFDGVTAMLWFASASEFNQTLRENSKINRLDDSLEIFKETNIRYPNK